MEVLWDRYEDYLAEHGYRVEHCANCDHGDRDTKRWGDGPHPTCLIVPIIQGDGWKPYRSFTTFQVSRPGGEG